jgi:hypothetical protein
MGRPWFVGGIFILSAVTYLMAIYIGSILMTITKIWEGIVALPIVFNHFFVFLFKPTGSEQAAGGERASFSKRPEERILQDSVGQSESSMV